MSYTIKHTNKPAIEVPADANYLVLRELYYVGENREPDRIRWMISEPGKPERESRSRKYREMHHHLTNVLGYRQEPIYDQVNRAWYEDETGRLPLISTYRYYFS